MSTYDYDLGSERQPRIRESGKTYDSHPDSKIARLAGAQRGVVSRSQLLAAGLSVRQVDRRVATGRLHPLFRGTYLAGHTHEVELARETAALLAVGRSAVLSHESAAWLWGIEQRAPLVVTLTVAGAERRRRRAGLRLHVVGELGRGEIRKHHGLAVTSPARTLLDLAGVQEPRTLARVVEEAQVQRLTSAGEVRAALDRRPGARGARALRKLLDAAGEPSLTRSEAERRALALLRAARLPEPSTNARIHGFELDMFWRERALAVEIDGFRYHSSRAAFERDRRRDAALAGRGLRVIRVTWRQIEHEPEAVVATIAQALAA